MKNNHQNMTTIKELLGQGDIPKPKRNFLQENVRRLKEMKLEKTNKFNSQRNKNLQPLTERRNSQMLAGSSRIQQPPGSPPRSKRTGLARVRHVTVESLDNSTISDATPKGYRSQGCQTLNGKQLENLYQEGVIRYASARHAEAPEREVERGVSVREMGLQTDTEVEVLHPPPDNSGLHWDEERDYMNGTESKDFVRMNATIPEAHRHRTGEHLSSSKTDPTRAPPTYQRGVIPKYLKEHKKELQRERITKAKEAADECPEGHILLPEEIKQQHLATLKQKYGDLVSQLNQLPVSTDTLRTRTRKKQIETDLDRVEAAIALFSREKVFVQADS